MSKIDRNSGEYFTVAECKVLYKSMRDALRYKRKQIAGKSGDSGDEITGETTKDGDESNDFLAFLTPTSSRFPRKTMVMGAGTEPTAPSASASSQNTFDDFNPDQEYDPVCDDESRSSVYSFVSILVILRSIFQFKLNYSINLCMFFVFYFQASKKRKTPDLVESSVVEMTKAFSNYVSQKKQDSEATQTQPTLKYNYKLNRLRTAKRM